MSLKTSYTDLCHNEQRGRTIVAALPDDLGREEHQTFLMVLEAGKWGSIRCDSIRVRSLASYGNETWVVGEMGELWILPKGAKNVEQHLPDSGHTDGRRLGPPNLIRRIGERLYVCGFSGQVYTQDAKGNWIHMDDGLAEKGPMTSKSLSLEGIAGVGPGRIFVCGSNGMLARWDGRKWTKIPLLTNVNLWSVRCFAKDDVWVVGDNGVVVHGDGDKEWHIEEIPGNDDSPLMDVDKYEGRIFVAAIGVLYYRKGSGWEKVKHGLSKTKTDFYKLTVGGGKLWAKGTKRLHSFDGRTWQSHPDGDNG